MRRFLHITTFMIAITSCIACESNFDRWVEKASTVNSPVSMTISIPELGIEDAVFESEGYPFLLLGINPWSPYIVLDNDFFEFDLEDIPNNGDVAMILGQYISCLEELRKNNVHISSGRWYWNVDGDENSQEIRTYIPEKYKK